MRAVDFAEARCCDSSAGTEFTVAVSLRRLHHRDARRRDQAFQRHLREYAEHDHDHEGAQIAAPEQHQRARAAAVRQHHAVAEQQPAEEHHRRGERRLQIDRLAEIDEAAPPPATASRRPPRRSPAHRCGSGGRRPPPTSRAGCSSGRSRSTARPRHRRGRSTRPA